MNSGTQYIGIDYGEKRIGIARIHVSVGIAEPLMTIPSDPAASERIKALVSEHQADGIVVGLARGLDGQETAQTAACRSFAEMLKHTQHVPVYLIDEAGSSKLADERMASGERGDRDSIAAAIILEDFASIQDKHSLEVAGS